MNYKNSDFDELLMQSKDIKNNENKKQLNNWNIKYWLFVDKSTVLKKIVCVDKLLTHRRKGTKSKFKKIKKENIEYKLVDKTFS